MHNPLLDLSLSLSGSLWQMGIPAHPCSQGPCSALIADATMTHFIPLCLHLKPSPTLVLPCVCNLLMGPLKSTICVTFANINGFDITNTGIHFSQNIENEAEKPGHTSSYGNQSSYIGSIYRKFDKAALASIILI